MTVPLSASLIAGISSVPPASKNAWAKSFQLLNTFSTMLAVLFMLPLVIIAASPRAPEPIDEPAWANLSQKASTMASDNFILGLRIATLVLSTPSVVVSITSHSLHGAVYRFSRTNAALSVIVLVILALSLVPPTITSILDDATLFLAIFGTFLLPGMFFPLGCHDREPSPWFLF